MYNRTTIQTESVSEIIRNALYLLLASIIEEAEKAYLVGFRQVQRFILQYN